MSLSDRAIWINKQPPQLVADIELYTTEAGGRTLAVLPGWGCPAMVDPVEKVAYDVWPILRETPLLPGDRRRLGLIFSNPEGADVLRKARSFFLWEGKLIGEGQVVDEDSLAEVFD